MWYRKYVPGISHSIPSSSRNIEDAMSHQSHTSSSNSHHKASGRHEMRRTSPTVKASLFDLLYGEMIRSMVFEKKKKTMNSLRKVEAIGFDVGRRYVER